MGSRIKESGLIVLVSWNFKHLPRCPETKHSLGFRVDCARFRVHLSKSAT